MDGSDAKREGKRRDMEDKDESARKLEAKTEEAEDDEVVKAIEGEKDMREGTRGKEEGERLRAR